MDANNFLPIGSVVQLIGYDEKIMIIGYLGFYESEKGIQAFDYIGCNLLEGYDNENIIVFDKEYIDNVIFIGYKNEENIKQLKEINRVYNSIKSFKSEKELDKYMEKGIIKKITSANIPRKFISLVSNIEKEEGKNSE